MTRMMCVLLGLIECIAIAQAADETTPSRKGDGVTSKRDASYALFDVKQELAKLCLKNGDCPTLIRIACRELKAWYLGDMDAIQKVYPIFKADQYRNKAKFRDPDTCNPSDELKKLIPNFQKGYASKEISKYISIENNRSASFGHFVSGLKRFLSSDIIH